MGTGQGKITNQHVSRCMMPQQRSDISVETNNNKQNKAEEISHSKCALYKELKVLITVN